MKSKIKLLALVLTLILSSSVVGYWVRAQTELNFTTVIENGSMVETASYIIFKDGSNYYARNGTTGAIDFSGIDAATVIQLAIYSGIKILLTRATYYLSTGLILDSGTILEGECPSSTSTTNLGVTLYLNSNAETHVITNSNYTGGNRQIVVRNLEIYGNSEGQTSTTIDGIYFENTDKSMIDFVRLNQCKRHSIHLRNSGLSCKEDYVQNCYILNSGNVGIYFHYVADSWIINNEINAGEHGIELEAGGSVKIMGNDIYECGGCGIYIYGGDFNIITSNRVNDCWKDGIFLWNVNDQIISNNAILDCSRNVSDQNHDGIVIYGDTGQAGKHNIIVGNQFLRYSATFTSYMRYGINEGDADCDYNLIQGNNFWNLRTYPVIVVGSHTEIEDNIGFVTENSGSQTVANGEAVTHGLAECPTSIIVTARTLVYSGNVTVVGVTSRTDGTFTVGCYWTNGTAITNDAIVIDWYAEYKP